MPPIQQSGALPTLANFQSLPGFHWKDAPSPELHASLSGLSSRDIFWLLGEILEPSRDGPFGKSYREDAEYEGMMDALHPVTTAYREAFDAVQREIGGRS